MAGLLKIGIPIAFQDGFIQISFLAITVFANMRGLNDAAAVGIVEKIIGIIFLVPSSMLQTVSALCAQNIGAGKHDRARRTLRYAAAIAVIWGIACGMSGLSFLHNSLSIVCVRIPVSYLASRYFVDTLFPMGLASTAGSALSVVICLIVYWWMRRRKLKM